MFTGIVEEAGVVQAVTRRGKGWSLEVEVGSIVEVKIGDSVAVERMLFDGDRGEGKEADFLIFWMRRRRRPTYSRRKWGRG